jgi:Tfp pilus assembly protein PilZ
MAYKEGASAKIADFLEPIERHKKEKEPEVSERRFDVRFNISGPLDMVLSYPAEFTVKTISLSGMLIRTEQSLAIESRVPMTLSLTAGSAVQFVGRVVVCQRNDDQEDNRYDIGVEFTNLTDKNIAMLKAFIDFLAESNVMNG